jgi:hypothetical protein
VSSLRSCGPLAYSDNEHAKQLLYAFDDHVWGMKVTALEEFADFATLDTEKLFSKLKSHELSQKGHSIHDASFTSKALISSARVGGHDANPTNTISPSLEFTLSSLAAASDEQYESIPDDKIALLAMKFHVLHKFRKGRRRTPRGCLECGNTTHFITDCPKRRSLTPTSMTIPTRMTATTKGTTRRRTALETTTRWSSRNHVPSVCYLERLRLLE